MRQIAVAAVLISVSVLGLHAEAQSALSMKDAVSLALANRPELKASAQRILASQHLEAQARLLPNPRLYLQSEDLHSSDFSFSRDAETYAYASEVIEISGRRKARTEVALQDVHLNTVRADQTRAQVVVSVQRAYWTAWRAMLLSQLYAKDADYFGQIIAYNEARFREGKSAEVDLLRVKLEGERVHAVAAEMQLSVARAMLKLAIAMGYPEGEWKLTEPFETLEAPRSIPLGQDPSLLRAEDAQARAAIEAARANLSFQKSVGRPDIDVLAGYKKNLGQDTAIAGLQLNLPLFNRNQGEVAAAQADTQAAEEDYKAVHLQLTSELKLSEREFVFERDEYEKTFKPLHDQAIEISDITRAAYREGGLDLLRLLDAERLRIEAEVSWVDALESYHQSVVSLEYAEGVQP